MIKRFMLMARKHWGTLAFACFGLLGATLLSLVTPGLIRSMTASLDSGGGVDMELIWKIAAALLITYLIRAVCRFISAYYSHVAAWTFVGELTVMIYDKLQKLSMRYYQDKQTGQIMSRLINDSRQLEVLVAHAVPDFITNALMVVCVTVILFTINVPLTLLTLTPIPVIVFLSRIFVKKIAPMFLINQAVLGDLNGMLQDNLSGMKEIQAFGNEKREYDKLREFSKHYSYVNIRANFYNGLYHPATEFFTSMGTVIVVAAGGYFALRFGLPTSDIIGFILYLSLFYQPVAVLARLMEDVQNAYAGGVRVFEILDADSEVKEVPGAISVGRTNGSIEFENVSFEYSKGQSVLKNISFAACPGQMVALVGPTGVGKTTVVSLLERFYDPVKGRVLIDGHDIKGLTIESLRAQMSMVLQDVFLFNGTIAENIAYGVEKASMEQIVQAARIARADGFISEMPDGYATLVGERGTRLSGGQKQRISIARAVLRDAPILILDEATAAVDVETEADIQDAIQSLAGGRTIIVIAHRLSTVMRADNILVLKDGEIVESGTHAQLRNAGGEYSKLCDVQWGQVEVM